MGKYYAVKNGKVPGIYKSWDECKEQVNGFSGAEYKSFTALSDAEAFMGIGSEVQKTETKISSDKKATAYVDGSFLKEKSMFSFGAVLFSNGVETHFKEAYCDPELISMWNVAGEIKGAEFIMQYCVDNDIFELDLYYDYEGIEKWCTGVWKANKYGTKRYSEFYKSISDRLKVNFIKVKGHSGDKYNDLADSLAKSALGIET